MISLNYIFQILIYAGLLCSATYLIGSVVPQRYLLKNYSDGLQRCFIGISILILLYRLPFRHDFNIFLADATIIVMLIVGGYKCLSQNINHLKNGLSPTNAGLPRAAIKHLSILLALSAPLLAIIISPMVFNGAFYLHNYGPDHDGNLNVARYLYEGYVWRDVLNNFESATGHRRWWQLWDGSFQELADYRETTAVYLLNSQRWGQAVLTMLISRTTGAPVWISFIPLAILTSLALTQTVREKLKSEKLEFRKTTLIILLIFSSQTYAMMYYEGLMLHWVGLPFFIFFSLNLKELSQELSTAQKFTCALVISAFLCTYGEGVQILLFFALLVLLFELISSALKKLPLNTKSIRNLGGIALIILIINPVLVVDFALWSYGRFETGFSGGALHQNWSVISILLSLPYFSITGPKVEGFKLLLSASYEFRFVEIGILLALSILIGRFHKTFGLQFAAICATIFFAALPGQDYALWKVAAFMQPLMIVCLFGFLFNTCNSKYVVLALLTMLSLNSYFTTALIKDYHAHSQLILPRQLEIKTDLGLRPAVAVLTPSQNRIYLQLGWQMPINWANGGFRGPVWEPNFKLAKLQTDTIYLYYDCDAEGASRCGNIGDHLGSQIPNNLFKSNLNIGELLGDTGVIDREKVNSAIVTQFGVPPLGNVLPKD